MTSTLTDRYLVATVRRVPDKHRRDIERELRAAIVDDVDARIELGETPADAEYAALCELGDPALLALNYTRRPTGLIGADTYPTYLRALWACCATVLPIVYIVQGVVSRAHGQDVWTVIFRPLGSTLTVGMYLAVCVTALFVLIDRQMARTRAAPGQRWTPDQLTAIDDPRPGGWVDVVSGIVVAALLIAALFVQRAVSPVSTATGTPIPIIAPALWGFWIFYFISVIVLALALSLVNLRLRDWHVATAAIGSVLTLAGTGPLAWLFWQARVLNPALSHGAGALATRGSWIAWLAILVLALVSIGLLAKTWRRRSRDGLAL